MKEYFSPGNVKIAIIKQQTDDRERKGRKEKQTYKKNELTSHMGQGDKAIT